MDKEILESIEQLVDYLYENEKEDYEAMSDEIELKDHIFYHVEKVLKFVEDQKKKIKESENNC